MRSIIVLSAGGSGSIEGNLIGLLSARFPNALRATKESARTKAMNTMRKSTSMAIIIKSGVFWAICSTENKSGRDNKVAALKSLRER